MSYNEYKIQIKRNLYLTI